VDAILDTNLKSIFRMSKAVVRSMTKARKGRIISISSIVGSSGNPGQCNYAAAKPALSDLPSRWRTRSVHATSP